MKILCLTTFFFLSLFNLYSLNYIEIKIPTRINDSSKKYLNVDLYYLDTNVSKPVIFIQTPYNKNLYRISAQNPDYAGIQNVFFDTLNYNYVIMDWRGFYSNSNADSSNYDRGLDGYDAIEWFSTQKWCNGKVGTFGGSALGQIQFQTARHQPPHLVCAAPWIKDYETKYTDYYYGGDLRLEQVESLEKLHFLTLAAVEAIPDYTNFWKLAEATTNYPQDFNVPMLLVSGWFDHYPSDVLRAFHDIREKSAATVRSKHKLIFGPWQHTELGDSLQGQLFFPGSSNIPMIAAEQFFDYYLLGVNNNWLNQPVIKYYKMGENVWRETDDWYSLAQQNDTLYLHRNGELNNTPPPQFPIVVIPPDTVVFNPRNPSPTIGGSRFDPFDKNIPMGPLDQRQLVENRKDVLIYSTPILTQDLVVTGRIKILLYVSSDRKDVDFSVRLCDVYPDSSSIIMTQGIRRMRFRNSYSTEELMLPDSIYVDTIELSDLAMTFKAGHQLRIIIANSDYPMFDINLNNGGAMYTSGDTLTATNLVYCQYYNPSKIIIPQPNITDVRETNFPEPKSELIIEPNPASDFITIKNYGGSILSGYNKISIYNSFGECLESINSKNSLLGGEKIDISQLPVGLYFIIVNNNFTLITLRFLVLR